MGEFNEDTSKLQKSIEFPNNSTASYDLIANGDLVVGPLDVSRTTGVILAVNSTDDNTLSVSVEWKDESGNIYQTESATDIEISSSTDDWARLVRKSQFITVTVTDESGAAQNNVNLWVGAQG